MGYYLLLPFIEVKTKRSALIIIGCSLIFVIIAYFIEHNNIGEFLAFSRFISFFPYFLAGHYSRKVFNVKKFIQMPNKNKIKWSIIFIPIYIITTIILILMDLPNKSIFRLTPDNNFKYSFGIPAIMLICNIALISLSLLWIPNKKIPIISYIGQNTMPLYLLHSIVILLVSMFKLFDHFSELINILISLGLSAVTVALFGNKFVAKLFKIVFQ